jgi:uridine kinase
MRTEVIVGLADLVVARAAGRDALRVAVDGPDAAGKTTLADELADELHRRGAPVARVSLDGFHHPRSLRHRRGPLSPEGYFADAFDLEALRREVLDRFGPDGDRRYRTAVFDVRTDTVVDAPLVTAAPGTVLLVDGVFLQRAESRSCWDLTVYVAVSEPESLRRALRRDTERFGSEPSVRERYGRRYLPAQRHYRDVARPLDADVVVDNDDPATPALARWPSATSSGVGRPVDDGQVEGDASGLPLRHPASSQAAARRTISGGATCPPANSSYVTS